MNNLHISLTEFKNESRVLKQTRSLVNSGLMKKIYIAALYAEGTKEEDQLSKDIFLKRFRIKSKNSKKNILAQVLKYLKFCKQIYKEYKNKDINIINVHCLNLLPLGIMLKYLYKSKLIYDTHELETEINGSHGIRKQLRKLIEKVCIKYVDTTFVVSENIADWYENTYQIRRPTVVMNSPNVYKLQKENCFRKNLPISEDQVIFLYQGMLSHGRGIYLLLEAFKKRADNKAVIVFMGYGPMEEEIIKTSIQFKNIFFHPAVSPNILLTYTESADVGFALIENTCLSYYFCMPNKLFEYAMSGLPVIVSKMKEMSDFVSYNDMGAVTQDLTTASISLSIDKLLNQNLDMLKNNARKTALLYSWESQEEKMIKEYNEMINGNKANE